MQSVREQVFAYVREQYGVEPEYPFSAAPDCPVLRHTGSRKWFALLMDVPREKLGLDGAEQVEILNLKCDNLTGSLRMQKGFLPSYHMNREKWVTILLDGTVPAEEIFPLIDLSYHLTSPKPKRRKA